MVMLHSSTLGLRGATNGDCADRQRRPIKLMEKKNVARVQTTVPSGNLIASLAAAMQNRLWQNSVPPVPRWGAARIVENTRLR